MSAEPIVRTEGLTKSFGAVRALQYIDLAINGGEVVALIGDNGAGKSTLVKILSGFLRPDAGRLCIHGKEVSFKRYSVRRARVLGIETVYQGHSLGEKQQLWRNVFVGRHLRNAFGFIRIGKEKEITLSLLQRSIGLNGAGVSADALVTTLSGGERQGLAISRAMFFNASLTILDEPTTALAVKEVGRVLDFVREIPGKGRSALFISHNLHHVYDVADRFVVLDRGVIVHQCMRKETSVAELFERVEALAAAPDRQGRGEG